MREDEIERREKAFYAMKKLLIEWIGKYDLDDTDTCAFLGGALAATANFANTKEDLAINMLAFFGSFNATMRGAMDLDIVRFSEKENEPKQRGRDV